MNMELSDFLILLLLLSEKPRSLDFRKSSEMLLTSLNLASSDLLILLLLVAKKPRSLDFGKSSEKLPTSMNLASPDYLILLLLSSERSRSLPFKNFRKVTDHNELGIIGFHDIKDVVVQGTKIPTLQKHFRRRNAKYENAKNILDYERAISITLIIPSCY